MSDSHFLTVLERHLPPAAVPYAHALGQAYPFRLRLARPRRTRLGDYRFSAEQGHVISVNVNLNPPAFLITYLHEVAHCIVQTQHGQRVAPHGIAWKTQFRTLLEPVLRETIFPAEVLAPLRLYARNPGATTASCPALMQALRRLDASVPEGVPLTTLVEGERFELNGRAFVRGPLRRTRYLCTDPASGRRYTVLADALVRKA